ncbi:uncharacterized protein LOC112559100 [Pomacea canaliculata]|uniref:uncharacterized protein LOC112559100 n=1 Tax=Pomacea canaliculata TaxID=400727 RepID=UPI000D732197|nr:uncharacterized protein LOC112559100 [Pomacea canaliculata]XP_025085813.1 uncharacterized protein LOC112559100 [Pomacea canaliculata]
MSCQYSCQNRHVGDRLHNEDMSEKSRHSLAVKSDFLEEVHVRKVYEQIAPHICDLKQRTWPGVRDFLESLAPGSLVADVGCGSGRYLQVNPSVFKIGLDICHIFLESAVVQGFEVLSANNLSLPFRDGIFDGIISIGVLHHLASTERQVIALQELSRVLSTGGRLMIYVWAFEQRFRRFESQDILVPWHPPHKTDRRQNKRSSSLTSSDTDRCSTSSAGSSISDDDSPSNTCCMQGYSNNMIDLLKSRVKLEGSFSEGTGQIRDANVDLVKECQRVKSFLSHLSCKADAGHQPGVSSEVSNDAIFLHLKEASQDSDSILSEVSCDAKMSQSHEFPQGLDIVKEFSQLQASSLPSQQQISNLPSPALVSNMPCEHPVFRTLSQSHAFTTPSLVQPTGVLGTSQMSSIPSHIQVSSTSSQPKIHTVPDKLGTLHVLDKLQPIRIEYKSDSLSLKQSQEVTNLCFLQHALVRNPVNCLLIKLIT